MLLRGGKLYRRTADTATPGDTPPASLIFFHQGDGRVWLAALGAYWELSTGAQTTPWDLTEGGTGAITAPDARENLEAAAANQLVVTVNTDVTLSSADARYGEIECQQGSVAARWTLTFPAAANLIPGQEWIVRNDTNFPAQVSMPLGDPMFLQAQHQQHVYFDGVVLKEVCQDYPQYGVKAISTTFSPSFHEEGKNDYWEIIPVVSDQIADFFPVPGVERGRLMVVQNADDDDNPNGLILTVKTQGAAADKHTVLLPGEWQILIAEGAGSYVPAVRPYTRVVTVTHDDTANYSVAHPDFLATNIKVTGVLTATRNLILPTCSHKTWHIANQTTQSIVVKTAAGSGPTITAGNGAYVQGDGTGIERLTPNAPPT